MRSMMARARAHRPKWAPGPWQPAQGQNIPEVFRTTAASLVRSHAFPRQDRTATLRALSDIRDFGVLTPEQGTARDAFFLPSKAFQGAQIGQAVGGAEVVTSSARRLGALQSQVLERYLNGGSLTPVQATELMRVRASRTPDYLSMSRAQNRLAGGPPAGARQVMAYPMARVAPQLVRAARAQAFAYGAGGCSVRRPQFGPAITAERQMFQRLFGGR